VPKAKSYPEIEALQGALRDHDLRLSVEPEEERLQSRSYRRVRLTLGASDEALSVPVDDEYGDATDDNQALLLHLVLAECACYEEADDLLVWAAETGLDPAESWVRGLYTELGGVVPTIRGVIGTDVKPLASWDFTLNGGAARALRDL
jgi:hypothetical protein